METKRRLRILLEGQVQGVGLRPTLYRYAREMGVRGWVSNSTEGTVLEVEGTEDQVESFLKFLPQRVPQNSVLTGIGVHPIPCGTDREFQIRSSVQSPDRALTVPPDLALCADCRRELFGPADRRSLYPFINCTACGPRFTILSDIPYDRPNTSMAGFPLCAQCRQEYEDPLDRRFHAEPVACPACGPEVSLRDQDTVLCRGGKAVEEAIRLMRSGKILAIQGLGGFHLACLAWDAEVVSELRRRKARPHKPFAVMVRDLAALRRIADPSAEECALLESAAAPIVSVRKGASPLPESVAPGLNRLGAMLPYTPLHALLFRSSLDVLVMTSGNRSDEPICKTDSEARERLGGIADSFLIHNRPIENRADDSVVFFAGKKARFLRRARGFVPVPIAVAAPPSTPTLLGTGAELKNCFCLLHQGRAYLSPHIGDLSDQAAMDYFEESFKKYCSYFDCAPRWIAHDLHPDYLSTQWAKSKEKDFERVGVQHHQAHVAGVLAEHGIETPVIGIAFDGTGLGLDGAIWGSEFFAVEEARFERLAHLKPFPLVGGDSAVHEIWKSAYGIVLEFLGEEAAGETLPPAYRGFRNDLRKMARDRVFSPPCTSMGRLFDAAAYLLGLRERTTYESQAAMELESSSAPLDLRESYAFGIESKNGESLLDPGPVLEALLFDLKAGKGRAAVSARFHGAVVGGIRETVRRIAEARGIRTVALSGGCFQNKILLEQTSSVLAQDGFKVLTNEKTPANDGGIALGQVWIAARQGRNLHVPRD